MAFNKENMRGQGKRKGAKGYVYFVLDRKTGQWGIYRYIARLCHEFGIDYTKLSRRNFAGKEFMDDGRYLVAGAALEIRGLGSNLQDYDTALKTLYKNAAMNVLERHRLEDIQHSRFKKEDDKDRQRHPHHRYKG